VEEQGIAANAQHFYGNSDYDFSIDPKQAPASRSIQFGQFLRSTNPNAELFDWNEYRQTLTKFQEKGKGSNAGIPRTRNAHIESYR
jgi:hypothetical protein